MRFLAGGQRIATEMFGIPIGVLDPGAAADLIVLDYPSPTPLHNGNLSWHVIFGMSHAHVESVIVAGKFLVKDRHFVDRDVALLYREAQNVAQKLWKGIKGCQNSSSANFSCMFEDCQVIS
jgi:cytosine/adenosine deaminase-related metal-dependent hydrolase